MREKPSSGYSYDNYLLDESGLKINPTSENYPTIYASNLDKVDSMYIYDRYYKSVVKNNNVITGNNTILYMNASFGFLRKDVYSNSVLMSKKLLKDKIIIR